MDAVAHLSRRDGLARVLPQALAAGKPIVAYDCDGAREVCIDDETGFLVKPETSGEVATQLAGMHNRLMRGLVNKVAGCEPDALSFQSLESVAYRLGELITKPVLCERLGIHGRELVKELFPTQRMVDDLHALYLRLQAEAKR
jgi:glycosyltransferase involved in cell wall biosynthesis